jgi:hypothetical protein
MRIVTPLLMLIAASPCLFAQQSMFETGDGKTALYLRQPAAAVNLGDSKASLSYIHDLSTNRLFFGASGYGTSNSGVSSLFSSDKAKAPEGGFDGVVGFRYDPAPCDNCSYTPKNNRFLIDAGYGRSSFCLYPTSATPSASVSKTNFDRFRAVAGWNLFTGSRVFGLAGGAERRNNLSDLKSVNLDTTVVAAPPGGSSSLVKSQAGYYGAYKAYIGAPIYEDALYFFPPWKKKHLGLDNRIGLDLMSRSDAAVVNRGAAGGIGLFLLDKKDPYKVVGGVTAIYDGSKFQLSLTTGLTSSK